jgi:hypothetical protein
LTRQRRSSDGKNRSGHNRKGNRGDHTTPEILKAGPAIRLDEISREYSDDQRCFKAFAKSDEKIGKNGVSFDC